MAEAPSAPPAPALNAPPPQATTHRPSGLLQWWNNLEHHHIMEPIFWLMFWSVTFYLMPLAFFPLLIIFIYDAWMGRTFQQSFLQPQGRAILITGCGKGFGKDVSIALAKKGWAVYAACRTEDAVRDLSSLNIPHLYPVYMDVTKEDHVNRVMATIDREHPEGLFGLVNNAGVAPLGLIDCTDVAEHRWMMEVNYFGVVLVTKAALPLLKKIKGSRIVNVTTGAVNTVGAMGCGSYQASKCATDKWTETLRLELMNWGILVIRHQPGFHATPMVENTMSSFAKMYDTLDESQKQEYGREYFTELDKRNFLRLFIPWDPINVTNDLVHATTATCPRDQYVTGMDLKHVLMVGRMIPTRAMEPFFKLMGFAPWHEVLPQARKPHTPTPTQGGAAGQSPLPTPSPGQPPEPPRPVINAGDVQSEVNVHEIEVIPL